MFDDVISLGTPTVTEDDLGNQQRTYEYRDVFAEVKSISQSEFYTAAQNGLKPALRFVLSDYADYCGEDVVLYSGQQYHVLRTFRSGMQLELTVEKRTEAANDG